MYDPPHFSRAARRLHNTRQFRQQAVAGIFDDTAMVLFDLRIEELAEMRLERFVRALVGSHQPRITRDESPYQLPHFRAGA
jgi:hypothetical protein